MSKNNLIVITQIADENPSLSFDELCRASGASSEFIHKMIEFDVIEPDGESLSTWRFHGNHLRRVRMALRLQHDLEVNLAGVAIILDLMEEIESMREQLQFWERFNL